MDRAVSKHLQQSGQTGFGIVEVLAALLILSVSLVPLLDLARSVQTQAQLIEHRQVRAEKIQSALSYFRTVNVGQYPQGEVQFSDWSLSWDAKLVNPEASLLQQRRFDTPRLIGLFDVELILSYDLAGQRRQSGYRTRSVGWSETGAF